jgi:hypothetical protein
MTGRRTNPTMTPAAPNAKANAWPRPSLPITPARDR